ncbi:MAG: NAD-dependent epimerase/dehydratase family protein, partial [Polyangiaceae bacterium]
ASRYLKRGDDVVVVDDLSRAGVDRNLAWLEGQGKLTFLKVDVRDAKSTERVFADHADAGLVLHLAAQVAVTTSCVDPRTDFEINALGTFNVLEGVRKAGMKAPLIYSSTNKVYGEMDDVGVVENDGRYAYRDLPGGVSESRGLDFHSPYGCSKGCADQYVRDYHRIYGLKTVVMRQSCIYGYRQFGAEDQGWVAWFMIALQLGRPITVYGDGNQVRDILFIDDLVDAYDAAVAKIDVVAGEVYNVGGGPKNVLSLRDLLRFLSAKRGKNVEHGTSDWRPGDQKVFVSDISKAARELDWTPKVNASVGLEKLDGWVADNLKLFE